MIMNKKMFLIVNVVVEYLLSIICCIVVFKKMDLCLLGIVCVDLNCIIEMCEV